MEVLDHKVNQAPQVIQEHQDNQGKEVTLAHLELMGVQGQVDQQEEQELQDP